MAWSWMAQIPVTRVRARLRPERAWTLPEAPEVTLRGALGRAMFEERCVQADRKCEPCPHRDTCPIPTWYDPGLVGSQAPRPFVVRAHAEAREVDPDRGFGAEWFFFGPVPDVLDEALRRMARDGLGAERVPHELHLDVEGPAGLGRFTRGPLGEPWHLELLTPVRVDRSHGRPQVGDVLRSAMLRVRSVARAMGATVERRWDLERARGRWVESEHVEASRYSSRQGETVDLSGWVGRIAWTEGADEVEDLIAAAEVLNVGRSTSAGLGWVERVPDRLAAEGPRLVAPVGAHPEVVADVVRSLGGVAGVMLVGFPEGVGAAEVALAAVFDGAVARFVLTQPVLGHPQLRKRIDAGEGDGFLGADVLLLAGEGLAGLAAWALAERSGGRVRRIAWEDGELRWWD